MGPNSSQVKYEPVPIESITRDTTSELATIEKEELDDLALMLANESTEPKNQIEIEQLDNAPSAVTALNSVDRANAYKMRKLTTPIKVDALVILSEMLQTTAGDTPTASPERVFIVEFKLKYSEESERQVNKWAIVRDQDGLDKFFPKKVSYNIWFVCESSDLRILTFSDLLIFWFSTRPVGLCLGCDLPSFSRRWVA